MTAPAVPALRLRVWVPLIVEPEPEKVMSLPAAVPPALVVSMVMAAANVVGPVRVMAPPAEVRLPPKEMEPVLVLTV